MQHEYDLTVRFGETDLLGHVSGTSYLTYMEQGRMRLFKVLVPDAAAGSWPFILASTSCDFISHADFSQELTVTTQVSRIGNKSFQLVQSVCDKKSGKAIATGTSDIVVFDFNQQKSQPIPSKMRDKLLDYLA